MANKKNNLLYLLGMALVVVGFCCPIFNGIANRPINGFNIIKSYDGFVQLGALLILIGAACGVILCFVDFKSLALLKFVVLAVCIAGGVVLFLGFNKNVFTQFAGKKILKCATYGFYLIIAGWFVGLAGYFTRK